MQTRILIAPLLVIVAVALLALAGCGGSNPAASGGGGGGGGAATAPAAPTGVAATAGNGQNTVSWTAVTGATSYNIYGGTASGSAVKGGTKIASATASPYTHSGLTSGTTYYYVVTAVNAAGESPASNLLNATPSPTTPPAPPAGVTATTRSTTQVDVNWTNVTGATGYNIYRTTTSPVASSTANKVNTAGPVAAGPFGNTGLNPGTTYYYVVTALNANGESALSQEASAATIPAAPTGLGATPTSSTQINLNWTAAPGAASYNVYRATTAGFTVSAANKVGNSAGAAFNDTGLTANTAYYYKVTAVNAGGESVPSTEAPATTPAPPAATPPAPPTGVTATTQSTTQVDVNWTNVTGATGYNIYRSTTSPVASSAANKVNTTGPVAAGPFANTGLAPGTTYYYVVTALNGNGASALSQEASAATIPAAPTGLSATPASSTQINLNWSAAAGAASYNVYRSTTAGFTVSAANKVGSSTWATFNDTGLTANTAYYYKVTAVNAGGESVPSTEATTTTPAPPAAPAAPTGVTATTQSTTQIDVNWTNVTGATGYNIYRSTTSPVASSAANKVNTTGPVAAGPFANTGLAPGTTYYYVVTALNGNGESALSQEASAATVPAVPTGVTATPGTSQNTISWNPVAGAASYKIYWSTTTGVTKASSTRITGATSPYTHTGLTYGTAYYYVVTAVNAGGESAESAQVSAIPGPSDITAGLAANYTCDGNVNDSTGTANGVPSGGFTYVADRRGNPNFACNFDGVDAKVHVASAIAPAGATGMTASFWINTGMTSFSGSEIYGSGRTFSFNGLIQYTMASGATNSVATPLTQNTWTHIVGTYDSATDLMKIYKDGVPIAQVTKGSTAGGLYLTSLDLGQAAYPASTFFAGALDEVRLYGRALSDAEVQQLYDYQK